MLTKMQIRWRECRRGYERCVFGSSGGGLECAYVRVNVCVCAGYGNEFKEISLSALIRTLIHRREISSTCLCLCACDCVHVHAYECEDKL